MRSELYKCVKHVQSTGILMRKLCKTKQTMSLCHVATTFQSSSVISQIETNLKQYTHCDYSTISVISNINYLKNMLILEYLTVP